VSSIADTVPEIGSIEPNQHGYRTFTLGSFGFTRDEYFAHVTWPKGHHMLPVDAFLRALQRDIAWGFFYGTVNFDAVVGTVTTTVRWISSRAASTSTTARLGSITTSGSRPR